MRLQRYEDFFTQPNNGTKKIADRTFKGKEWTNLKEQRARVLRVVPRAQTQFLRSTSVLSPFDLRSTLVRSPFFLRSSSVFSPFSNGK